MPKLDAADAVFNPAKTEARDFIKRTVASQSSSSLTLVHTILGGCNEPAPTDVNTVCCNRT